MLGRGKKLHLMEKDETAVQFVESAKGGGLASVGGGGEVTSSSLGFSSQDEAEIQFLTVCKHILHL